MPIERIVSQQWARVYLQELWRALAGVSPRDRGAFVSFLTFAYVWRKPMKDRAGLLAAQLGMTRQCWVACRTSLLAGGLLAPLTIAGDSEPYLTLGRAVPLQRVALEQEWGLPYRHEPGSEPADDRP